MLPLILGKLYFPLSILLVYKAQILPVKYLDQIVSTQYLDSTVIQTDRKVKIFSKKVLASFLFHLPNWRICLKKNFKQDVRENSLSHLQLKHIHIFM